MDLNSEEVMRIWKYVLKIDDRQKIYMPTESEILSAQMQRDNLCLWALVDESKIQVDREIAIYGTGNPMPENPGKFISTFQLSNSLVFHIFDLGYIF